MTSGRVQDQSGYAAVTQRLAGQALGVAFDAAPHRAREGERRWAVAQALPAARVLIDAADDADRGQLVDAAQQLAQTLADPAGKVTDGFGHTRPVYAWLALHVVGSAAKLAGDAAAFEHVARAARSALSSYAAAEGGDPRLVVWPMLVAWQHGVAQQMQGVFEAAEEPSPLAPLGRDDLIDAWTYNELVALHALHLHARLRADDQALRLAANAAEYHLGHTQPDYTTYQPWGLACFASSALTAVFAEQQLHDVATHLSIEGPGGAVLPAVLLADAWAAMSGALVRAWSVG